MNKAQALLFVSSLGACKATIGSESAASEVASATQTINCKEAADRFGQVEILNPKYNNRYNGEPEWLTVPLQEAIDNHSKVKNPKYGGEPEALYCSESKQPK